MNSGLYIVSQDHCTQYCHWLVGCIQCHKINVHNNVSWFLQFHSITCRQYCHLIGQLYTVLQDQFTQYSHVIGDSFTRSMCTILPCDKPVVYSSFYFYSQLHKKLFLFQYKPCALLFSLYLCCRGGNSWQLCHLVSPVKPKSLIRKCMKESPSRLANCRW